MSQPSSANKRRRKAGVPLNVPLPPFTSSYNDRCLEALIRRSRPLLIPEYRDPNIMRSPIMSEIFALNSTDSFGSLRFLTHENGYLIRSAGSASEVVTGFDTQCRAAQAAENESALFLWGWKGMVQMDLAEGRAVSSGNVEQFLSCLAVNPQGTKYIFGQADSSSEAAVRVKIKDVRTSSTATVRTIQPSSWLSPQIHYLGRDERRILVFDGIKAFVIDLRRPSATLVEDALVGGPVDAKWDKVSRSFTPGWSRHTSKVMGISAFEDGEKFVSLGGCGTCKLWDVSSLTCESTVSDLIAHVTPLCFPVTSSRSILAVTQRNHREVVEICMQKAEFKHVFEPAPGLEGQHDARPVTCIQLLKNRPCSGFVAGHPFGNITLYDSNRSVGSELELESFHHTYHRDLDLPGIVI